MKARKKDVSNMIWDALWVFQSTLDEDAGTWEESEWHKRGVRPASGNLAAPDERTIALETDDGTFEVVIRKPRKP